jgi:phosphoglycerol transferase MdoB-like AlkP superfamily enzyme
VVDAPGLCGNFLWILGLALLLAALSWSSWLASVQSVRFRAVLARPGVQAALYLGLSLFSAGLAATAHTWWERVLWLLLTVWWLAQAWMSTRRKDPDSIGDTD